MGDSVHEIMYLSRRAVDEVICAGEGQGVFSDRMPMRIASIFIVLVASLIGSLFPIMARQSTWIRIPKTGFDLARFFGSGVIISTAFIHLLAPGIGNLGSNCLPESWSYFPYALLICMLSIFFLFVVELIAFRWGTAKLAKLGVEGANMHGHHHGANHDVDALKSTTTKDSSHHDVELAKPDHREQNGDKTALHHVIGIAILEFGVAFHSVLIGLTFAVSDNFKILFIVIIFHQVFEGLGIGSRLAYINLGPKYRWVPYAGAILFSITTPVGIAAGLGARSTYVPNSDTSIIINGIMYSVSAGIMIYTGLVELLAADFLHDPGMQRASNAYLSVSLFSLCAGAALMTMLGIWF